VVDLNRRQVHQRSTEVDRIIQTISAETVGLIVRDQLADTCRAPPQPGEVVALGEELERVLARGAELRRRAGGAALAAGPVYPGALAAVASAPPSGPQFLPLSHTHEARSMSGPAGP
jgi:hypothetical protein